MDNPQNTMSIFFRGTAFVLLLSCKSDCLSCARNFFCCDYTPSHCVPEMYSPVRYPRHLKHPSGCYGFRCIVVLVTKINHFLETWSEWRKNYKGIQKAALKLEESRLLSRNTGICVTVKRIRTSFWRKKKQYAPVLVKTANWEDFWDICAVSNA